MDKNELIKRIDKSFNDVIHWYKEQPQESFILRSAPDKWTAGQHALHLLKTASAYNKGLSINKLILKYKFGTNNRTERNFEETRARYKEKLLIADPSFLKSNDFTPQEVSLDDKDSILAKLNSKSLAIQSKLAKWPEAKLSKLLFPHPAMGKMTVREMAYFIAFHNDHHVEILEKSYSKLSKM